MFARFEFSERYKNPCKQNRRSPENNHKQRLRMELEIQHYFTMGQWQCKHNFARCSNKKVLEWCICRHRIWTPDITNNIYWLLARCARQRHVFRQRRKTLPGMAKPYIGVYRIQETQPTWGSGLMMFREASTFKSESSGWCGRVFDNCTQWSFGRFVDSLFAETEKDWIERFENSCIRSRKPFLPMFFTVAVQSRSSGRVQRCLSLYNCVPAPVWVCFWESRCFRKPHSQSASEEHFVSQNGSECIREIQKPI